MLKHAKQRTLLSYRQTAAVGVAQFKNSASNLLTGNINSLPGAEFRCECPLRVKFRIFWDILASLGCARLNVGAHHVGISAMNSAAESGRVERRSIPMNQSSKIEVPVDEATAFALSDSRQLEAVGRLIDRLVRPGVGDPLIALFDITAAEARGAGLTDADIAAELADYNAERRV